jgi:hypothetical protein
MLAGPFDFRVNPQHTAVETAAGTNPDQIPQPRRPGYVSSSNAPQRVGDRFGRVGFCAERH